MGHQRPGKLSTTDAARLPGRGGLENQGVRQLGAYKGLVVRWHDWSAVVSDCADLADAIVEMLEGE
jgi:hypothetical protein